MDDIYMIWVAAKGRPTRMCKGLAEAMDMVAYLKGKGITREIYVFKAVEIIPGRKLLKLNKDPYLGRVERKT